MSVLPPFQINASDIVRSTLEPSDLGAWAILVCGCFHLFETEAAARRAYQLLLENRAVR